MISPDTQERIANNNRKISALLRENEELLRQEGYDPPINNFSLPKEDRITIPSGYIRTVAAFTEKYHLAEIFPQRYAKQNVTYALEVSDLINFMMSRLRIWGPVETVFYKLAIVNLVSIMEAIILEAANNICHHSQTCKKTKTCLHHFSKAERSNSKRALQKLVSLNILDFDEEEVSRIQEIIDFRNRIHIRLTQGSELKLDDFNLLLYNETVELLQNIDRQIYEKAVSLYNCK